MLNNCNCSDLDIPEYLHTNDKLAINDFTGDELLYRRFKPIKDPNGDPNIFKDGTVSKSIFSTKTPMSCNRQKYSLCEKDVLFNTNKPEHFVNWGIIALKVGIINEFKYVCSKDDTYTLNVLHEPHPCMYPHSSVYIIKNGRQLDGLEKPESPKIKIKEYYSKNATILTSPEE